MIDYVAVERLTKGQIHPRDVTPDERRAAVAELTARGWSIREITTRTKIERRVVEKYRGEAT